MDQIAKETLPISLEEEMKNSYLDYAMSVIVGKGTTRCTGWLKTSPSKGFVCDASIEK